MTESTPYAIVTFHTINLHGVKFLAKLTAYNDDGDVIDQRDIIAPDLESLEDQLFALENKYWIERGTWSDDAVSLKYSHNH